MDPNLLFIHSWISLNIDLLFPLGWGIYISSYHAVVPYVHILCTAVYILVGSHWHTLGHEHAPGGYEVTFQVNPLIHSISLMLWFGTECKLDTLVLIWLRPAGISRCELHTTRESFNNFKTWMKTILEIAKMIGWTVMKFIEYHRQH